MIELIRIAAGYKTYIAALAMALTALSSWWLEMIDTATMWQRLLEAAALAGLRAGGKAEAKDVKAEVKRVEAKVQQVDNKVGAAR